MSVARMLKNFLLVFIAISFSIIIAAQTPAATANPPAPLSTATASEMLISGGDLLHVSVLGASEFDRDLRVSDSGQITLPMAGEINVAGHGVTEAQQIVAKKLKDMNVFVDPQVTLFVKEFATLGVSVMGEVQKPGVYTLLGRHTLYDAISMAGGTTPKAGRAVNISHRDSGGKTETVLMTNGPNGDATGNVPISPGDTIVVSKAGMVYVIGDVRQPTGIVLDNPELTVLQAIAIAQGTNSTASLNNARVLRKNSKGVEQIPVPLKQIMSAQATDIMLKPEDVLFIPTSATKSAARRSIEAILQTATGVAIYRR
jgi:polysaccharide biosynthesis/export protein